MVTIGQTKPTAWWETIIAILIPAVWVSFLIDKAYVNSMSYWIGYLLTTLFPAGIYLLFRMRFNRGKSVFLCISSIIIVSCILLAAVYMAAKR